MEKKLEEYLDLQLKALYGQKERMISELNVIIGRIKEIEVLKSGDYSKAVDDYKKQINKDKQEVLDLSGEKK